MTEKEAKRLARIIQRQDKRVSATAGLMRRGGKEYRVELILFPGTPDARRLSTCNLEEWDSIRMAWLGLERCPA